MLNVVMLNIVMFIVFKLSVVMLNVVAPVTAPIVYYLSVRL